MHALARSYFRGFSNPADRTTWSWIALAAIVVIIVAFLATAGRENLQIASRDGAADPRQRLVPPIMQPAPVTPNDIGEQTGL